MIGGENRLNFTRCRVKGYVYTERSFEKSFPNIVKLSEIKVVPTIKNKVLYSLHIIKGFYTSLPKMIVTFRRSAKSIFPWKCPTQKYRSLFSKKYLLTPCVLRDMLVLDISKVSKSERNRGRQRTLQIFTKNYWGGGGTPHHCILLQNTR